LAPSTLPASVVMVPEGGLRGSKGEAEAGEAQGPQLQELPEACLFLLCYLGDRRALGSRSLAAEGRCLGAQPNQKPPQGRQGRATNGAWERPATSPPGTPAALPHEHGLLETGAHTCMLPWAADEQRLRPGKTPMRSRLLLLVWPVLGVACAHRNFGESEAWRVLSSTQGMASGSTLHECRGVVCHGPGGALCPGPWLDQAHPWVHPAAGVTKPHLWPLTEALEELSPEVSPECLLPAQRGV